MGGVGSAAALCRILSEKYHYVTDTRHVCLTRVHQSVLKLWFWHDFTKKITHSCMIFILELTYITESAVQVLIEEWIIRTNKLNLSKMGPTRKITLAWSCMVKIILAWCNNWWMCHIELGEYTWAVLHILWIYFSKVCQCFIGHLPSRQSFIIIEGVRRS